MLCVLSNSTTRGSFYYKCKEFKFGFYYSTVCKFGVKIPTSDQNMSPNKTYNGTF